MSKHEQENEMSNVLKVLLIIAILAVIGSLIFGGYYYLKHRPQDNSQSQNNQSTNVTENKNEVQNVVEEPKEEEPKEEEPKEEPTEEPKEEEKPNEEVSINDEDKAIEMVKKAYGTTEGVYFNIDQPLGNGEYDISVRDSETTSAIEWYRVNVRTGTVQ